MLVIIQKNLSGLGKSFRAGQVIEIPDDVGAEWCRIGYAIPASPAQPEKTISKISPEVRNDNPRVSPNSDTAHPGTSNTARSKKPSKS
jgi:hypothetical protein